MLIGKHFKAARESLGLSEAEVAQRIRSDFQDSLLWDFEAGDDNDIDGWSVQDFKAYCNVLNLKPTDYVDIAIQGYQQLPLNELVQRKREEKGYSVAELSERIGYNESVIEALEGRRSGVIVCMHPLKETALWLDIPFRLLIEKGMKPQQGVVADGSGLSRSVRGTDRATPSRG